jgi:hypothetical protein
MLSRASDPLTLETVRNTLDVVNKWTTGNDFGIAPVLGIKAFYEPEKIIEKIKSSPWRNNLTVFQDGGGIETSGIVEAINAMLLQSHDGVIRVFPNWPSHTGAKFKRLRAQGAFLVDAEFSSPETKTLAVYSEAGKTCSIENPWPGQTLKVSANGSRNIATRRQGEIYTFNTSPGTRYILTRKDN